MTGSILIVEDDEDISNLINAYMTREGFTTRVASSGEAALAALQDDTWDLILLDINLPQLDGFEVLREIRSVSSVPVIVVTARQEEMDAVFGLGVGADEYVTKPFSPKVLVARVRALLRRTGINDGRSQTQHNNENGRPVQVGNIVVNVETARVLRDGTEIQLTPLEFGVLRYLIECGGRPAGPEEIYRSVWKNEFGDVSSVAVHIQRLRRKLEEEPSKPRFITTRHGYGYAVELDRQENE